MSNTINLSEKIENCLPAKPLAIIREAAAVAASRNMELYLVGGSIRDLLLGQTNNDLDLVVEGNAITLAKELVEKVGGKLTVHMMFNTGKIVIDKWSIDVAMARTETYAKPGALPAIMPGTLKTDLFRRDFTVNAMAVTMNHNDYGVVVDFYDGLSDLRSKLIRILHDKSFIDDATRIWRAIRYEQRLGFKIEPHTFDLLKRDVPLLKTVGGYRLRRELELVLKENEPEKVLVRADKLGILKDLAPSLVADDWLVSKFKEARMTERANPDIYLRLLTCRLTDDETLQLSKYLRFSTDQIRIITNAREIIT